MFVLVRRKELLNSWFRTYCPSWLTPNQITLARLLVAIALLPWVFWGEYQGSLSFAAILVAVLLTDALDGAIARALAKKSAFGSLFDKITDKILIVPLGFVEFWPADPYLVCLSLLGMAIVVILAVAGFFQSGYQQVPENFWGKATMVLYSTGVVIAIWPDLIDLGRILGWLGFFGGVVSLALNHGRYFGVRSLLRS